ncbi:MAG: Smr/MutS family protein [Aestuariivita sp.]|nr:Smr/MutS family protein [Aestuariivita sp.]
MGRKLREEEISLWQKIVKDDKPLKEYDKPLKKCSARNKSEEDLRSFSEYSDLAKIESFRIGEKAEQKKQASHFASFMINKGKTVHLKMDKKKLSLMKKGKMSPEQRIDLHGMTLEQAHSAVCQFIPMSRNAGLRLLLIISGKGSLTGSEKLMEVSRGVIRRNLPQWLEQPSLSKLILYACPAHAKHGGDGAYYVYLRR